MFTSMVVRLKALMLRRRTDGELGEELRYHLDRETERNVAGGMSPRAARDAARRALGNLTIATEQARDAWRWQRLEELRQDVSFAGRTFRRAPTFVVTVIATIGLGLGLLASAFTLLDAYVLRQFAVREPYSLYELTWESRSHARGNPFSWAQYQSLPRDGNVLTDAYVYAGFQARIHNQRMVGQFVTGNYFQMLGVPPAIGRTLLPADASVPREGAALVISHQIWETAFGADSAVVGRVIPIAGQHMRIVGVARAGFAGVSSVPLDFWMPISMAGLFDGTTDIYGPENARIARVVVRLAPGVTVDRATIALGNWVRTTTPELPARDKAVGVALVPRGTAAPLTFEVLSMFAPLIVAFGLVLLIACANVANMMLARGMARQREIGIRLAIGADRGRLIRQLLTESVLLAMPAAGVGFLMSRLALAVGMRALLATVPKGRTSYFRIVPLTADAWVLAFMIGMAVVAAVAFGLVPAIQATKPSVVHAARGDFDTQLRPSRLRNVLVVTQITVSALLLICAGVLLRSARHFERLDPGFGQANVVQINASTPRARMLELIRREPFVRQIATAWMPPLDGGFDAVPISPSALPAERTSYNVVSPEYFPVIGLPVVRGRNFSEDESRARAPVALVSEGAAKRFWPGAEAIGKIVTISPSVTGRPQLGTFRVARVIGVVRNASPGWIGDSPSSPVVYYPTSVDSGTTHLLVQVRGDEEAAQAILERDLAAVDSGTVEEMHTLRTSVAVQVYPFRFVYALATAVGIIALLLTVTGVYGVISYLVAQRTKEFGIRLALGAAKPRLIALVLRQSLRLAAVGLCVGAFLALGIAKLLASALFTVNTYDPIGYAVGMGVVFGACALAAYFPSRRAAMVDPVKALRSD